MIWKGKIITECKFSTHITLDNDLKSNVGFGVNFCTYFDSISNHSA
ncbi:hypothetical protein THOG11_160117 [Vibrio harveyi]|nr:hypothetical protein VHARVF571_220028 [Vibrio harveyi]CAH1552168.1 hypothetical protein THOD03_160116 [Vibrio harveyi]CAH1558222.1 hypothetical protein THOG11_160117 [Vibrio harveyi]